MNIVIDTNRFISALMKDGSTRKIILNTNDTLLFPEFEFQEIIKHKEDFTIRTELSEIELNILIINLLRKVRVVETDIIIDYKSKADEIMKEIDLDDSAFIATALAFNCPVWSHDNHFKEQNVVNIMTNYDMFQRMEE